MGILVFSVIIGTQFFLSAITKYRELSSFLAILKKYPLPLRFKNHLFAFLIIIFELLLGISLLSLQREIIWFGFFGASIFILAATLLAFIRLLKGERKFRCGCGESINEEQSAVWLLIRNLSTLGILIIGLNSNINPVTFFSEETLKIFLIGFGLLAIIKLLAAVVKGLAHIKQWKSAG